MDILLNAYSYTNSKGLKTLRHFNSYEELENLHFSHHISKTDLGEKQVLIWLYLAKRVILSLSKL